MNFQTRRAIGAWFGTALRTVRLIHDPAALRRFGISISALAPAAAAENPLHEAEWFLDERRKIKEFFDLLIEVAAARSWSQVQFSVCQPEALAVVLHADQHLSEIALREQRQVWRAVLRAEHLLANGALEEADAAALKSLMQDLAWNNLQVARESYLVAEQCAWRPSDTRFRAQVSALLGGPCQTKFELEDLFAHLASVARASNLPVAMNKRLVRTASHRMFEWVRVADVVV